MDMYLSISLGSLQSRAGDGDGGGVTISHNRINKVEAIILNTICSGTC